MDEESMRPGHWLCSIQYFDTDVLGDKKDMWPIKIPFPPIPRGFFSEQVDEEDLMRKWVWFIW